MENDFSAIRSIQELKNLLDSGAITPQEYEALKRKIIFGPTGADVNPAPVTPPITRSIVTDPPTPAPIVVDPVTPPYRNERMVPPISPVPPVNVNPVRPAEPAATTAINEDIYVEEKKKKDWLLTTLIILGVLLLLGLIGYNLLSDSESERLTSTSGPETEVVPVDTTANAEEVTTSTRPDRIDAVGDTATTAAAIPPAPVPTPTPDTAATTTTNTTTSTAKPEAATPVASTNTLSEVEILSRINNQLESYYEDIQTSPFSAERHFAPRVERYYTLQNTTPASINENINTYHFPEFQDSESSIEGGTMKLTSKSANGYEVTYLEHGSAFRKSKGQKQETTARVRARFDPNFKMTYFRQEALLENKFVE